MQPRRFSQEFTVALAHSMRLIATDMDGTLTCNGKFTPNLLQALTELQRQGTQVLIVTGRSAGWVSGLVSYLPVTGAIAENGGLFYGSDNELEGVLLVPIPDPEQHRQQLAQVFAQVVKAFPQLQPSADNRFRISDWTFDNQGFDPGQLHQMGTICQSQGWDFTYSAVQCHIKLPAQSKRQGLLRVLQTVPRFQFSPDQVLTVGDSPNDASLFDPKIFPHSVGVANVCSYLEQLEHSPAYITDSPEVQGFCELVRVLLR